MSLRPLLGFAQQCGHSLHAGTKWARVEYENGIVLCLKTKLISRKEGTAYEVAIPRRNRGADVKQSFLVCEHNYAYVQYGGAIRGPGADDDLVRIWLRPSDYKGQTLPSSTKPPTVQVTPTKSTVPLTRPAGVTSLPVPLPLPAKVTPQSIQLTPSTSPVSLPLPTSATPSVSGSSAPSATIEVKSEPAQPRKRLYVTTVAGRTHNRQVRLLRRQDKIKGLPAPTLHVTIDPDFRQLCRVLDPRCNHLIVADLSSGLVCLGKLSEESPHAAPSPDLRRWLQQLQEPNEDDLEFLQFFRIRYLRPNV